MTPKRKEAQDYILKYIEKISKSKENVKLYEYFFSTMNDKEFHTFMEKLRDDKIRLCITAVPGNDKNISVENNLQVAKELGHKFFQRLKISPSEGMPGYTTPNEFMVIKLPIRRAQQLLTKKISVAKDNSHIDMLSGQVSGDSRSAKLTYPELQILSGVGMDKSITELLKYRGGDLGGQNAMNKMLMSQGVAHQSSLNDYSSGVKSTDTLNAYFNAMHIKTTLKKK